MCRGEQILKLFLLFFGLLALGFTNLLVQARQNTRSYNDKFNIIFYEQRSNSTLLIWI